MRVLVLTKIFPNSLEPLSSPFNRQQVAAMRDLCEVAVIAPVPWFPGAGLLGSRLRAGRLSGVPSFERIEEIPTHHPRGLYLPGLATKMAVPLLARSLASFAQSERGAWDVVLGTWLYPDAC